jgi:hypothetical protein
MVKKVILFCCVLSIAAAYGGMEGLAQEGQTCSWIGPWKVEEVIVGKTKDGRKFQGAWFKGSFPSTESRVTDKWFINGKFVGKSFVHFKGQYVSNSAFGFQTGTNTVMVRFSRPPYEAGCSFECSINNFDWSDVPKGGYKTYPCSKFERRHTN